MRFVHPFWRAYDQILLGFPPADARLRSWVLSEDTNDQVAAQKRLHGLVYALLTVTHATLETIENQSEKKGEMTDSEEGVIKRQAKLAFTFRNRMTEGQSFKGSNVFREDFYNKVIESANKVNFHRFPRVGEDDSLSSLWKAVKRIRLLRNRMVDLPSSFLKTKRG